MKRVLSFIFLALWTAFFSTAYAQQAIYIWHKNGHLSEISNNDVDSLTFSVSDWLFNIQTSGATSVTDNTLQASVNASYACEVSSLPINPKVGVCFSSVNETPTCADEYLQIGDTVGTFKFTIYELDPGTTCYYRGYVKLGDEVIYGNVKSCTTLGNKPETPGYTIVNGHKFVDLGLPSGMLWAHTNVGATFSFEDGEYFAWGEVKESPSYWFYYYKWGSKLTKYNSSDGKTILDPEDDVATTRWGSECRMPSVSDYQELCDNCEWLWKENYQGSNGYLVTGPNGKTIFFPASGSYGNDHLNFHGDRGFYWSRSLYSNIDRGYHLGFGYSDLGAKGNEYRCIGMTVRPVAEKR